MFRDLSAETKTLCMAFTTEGFFEVAIKSWPECDLNLHITSFYCISYRMIAGSKHRLLPSPHLNFLF